MFQVATVRSRGGAGAKKIISLNDKSNFDLSQWSWDHLRTHLSSCICTIFTVVCPYGLQVLFFLQWHYKIWIYLIIFANQISWSNIFEHRLDHVRPVSTQTVLFALAPHHNVMRVDPSRQLMPFSYTSKEYKCA